MTLKITDNQYAGLS